MTLRKLLILDLNGTLLLRSKHSRGAANGGPKPRTVYPRPYLQSFRAYILHTKTRAWLDAMVWSSAQPASVADMVHHAFGGEQDKFLGIWARDTLGIPPELYHKKTQTTKDLATPWAAFPAHNAQTTLLLDDSERKAHLHPFNHVCVPEYTADTRRRDLALLNASSGPAQLLARVRKVNAKAPATEVPKTYDETLLAVVGILDTLKATTSVAEWIENGGLLGPVAEAPTPDALAEQLSDLALDTPEAQTRRWFEREDTVRHWADAGRRALADLEIDVVVGVAANP
ncbi:Phosphoprotein phosphatase [Mycena kentingensis (nom. inval.)]|nr:Phosphoprotein phosphatase [Mycena kentingensis (nom. inval.)]